MGTEETALAKYSEFDLEACDEVDKATQVISTSKTWRFEDGENLVRFLPAKAGKPGSAAFRVTAVHFVEPLAGMDKKVAFNCPRIEKVGECIVCKRSDELMATGNPLDKNQAYDLRARLTVFANVLDRDQPDMGPRVAQFGKSVWEDLKKIRKARSGGNFTDPTTKGFDIVVTKTGSGMDTEYSVIPDRGTRPACDEAKQFAEVMAACKDLDQYVDTTIPEELLEAYAALARVGRGKSQRQLGRGRTAVQDARGYDGDPFEEPADAEIVEDDEDA